MVLSKVFPILILMASSAGYAADCPSVDQIQDRIELWAKYNARAGDTVSVGDWKGMLKFKFSVNVHQVHKAIQEGEGRHVTSVTRQGDKCLVEYESSQGHKVMTLFLEKAE